jgi:hypothetical protein
MVAKLYEAACKGTHMSQGGPDDDGSDENFVYGASPASDNSRGYTAGHFALELEGPTVDYGTGSFIIANIGNPATIDASSPHGEDTSSCSSGSLAVLHALVESDFFLI